MTAPKQEAKKIIDSLPEDTSYDEIIKELAFDRMIQRGLKDSKENKTISNKEMNNRIKQWQRYTGQMKQNFGLKIYMTILHKIKNQLLKKL